MKNKLTENHKKSLSSPLPRTTTVTSSEKVHHNNDKKSNNNYNEYNYIDVLYSIAGGVSEPDRISAAQNQELMNSPNLIPSTTPEWAKSNERQQSQQTSSLSPKSSYRKSDNNQATATSPSSSKTGKGTSFNENRKKNNRSHNKKKQHPQSNRTSSYAGDQTGSTLSTGSNDFKSYLSHTLSSFLHALSKYPKCYNNRRIDIVPTYVSLLRHDIRTISILQEPAEFTTINHLRDNLS